MKFLIIGDLHGQIPRIKANDFDAIIAPGDFCSDKMKSAIFRSLKKRLQNPEYDGMWWDAIGKAKARTLVRKSFADGKKVLSFLNKQGVPVYGIPGNWEVDTMNDDMTWFKRMAKQFKNIHDCHFKIRVTKECVIIGYGFSSGPEIPPTKTRARAMHPLQLLMMTMEYQEIMEKLSALFVRAQKKNKPIIFISHNVPYGRLDVALDERSPRYGEHVGSVVARDIVKKFQPLLCIGAHIHEFHGKAKIGKTLVINAGFGKHVNTLVEILLGRVRTTFIGPTQK